MYENTTACVWDGTSLSEFFMTNGGVRQGCPLSPLLFSFFINDLEEEMETGMKFGALNIKCLMYADDIVVLASEPEVLQRMISSLDNYCQKWNLQVNLGKSKVMIFQKGGGRNSREEKWMFQGSEIEIVKRYTYLGITLTPKLSVVEHLKTKVSTAKNTINSTWRSFILNKNIDHSAKFRLFDAVSKAIMCYGSQVWGFSRYDEVEKLLRFFLKRLFLLPQQTPNYALMLETGLPSMFSQTLKHHYDYLLRVLFDYEDRRLPKRLAREVQMKKIYWYEELHTLSEKHNMNIEGNFNTKRELKEKFYLIISKEQEWERKKAVERAEQTVRHGLYNNLNYSLNDLNYFRDDFSIQKINLILRYRCGLVPLNASPWRKEGSSVCELCNLEEDEDIIHFLGKCPIMAELRIPIFGKRILTVPQIIELLNGSDYDALFKYAQNAWKYRRLILEEFA